MRRSGTFVLVVVGVLLAGCGAGGGGGAVSGQASARPEPSVSTVAPSFLADEAPPAVCSEQVSAHEAGPVPGAEKPRYTIIDLGVQIRSRPGAVMLNNAGAVVGTREADSGSTAAFIWDRQSGARDIVQDADARALNEAGQVAGAADGPFLWDPSAGLRRLDMPDGFSARLTALNDVGVVVGSGWYGDEGREQAFTWSQTQGATLFRDLGSGLGSNANDVNNSGQVVVTMWPGGDRDPHVLVWTPGATPRDLGQGNGASINETGQVASTRSGCSSDPGPCSCGFLWDPQTGTRTYLGGDTAAGRLNDKGQVIGGFWPDHDVYRAFIWDADTGITDLGVLAGAKWSDASDVNESGHVVGSSGVDLGSPSTWVRDFVWDPEAGVTDLGALRTGESSYAWDINDRGQIVGWSGSLDPDMEGDDVGHAVLWTPE